jgi:acyl carrier protein
MKVLGKIFAGRPLDFLCCCSSGSASLAPFGQLAYIAANLYQDAFAEGASYPYPVISIEWPAIREIGMAVNSLGQNNPHSPGTDNPAAAEDPLRYGLNPSDAIPVLSTAIYLRLPVQVISTWDFAKAFRNSRVLLTAEEEDLQLDQVRERGDLPGHYIAPETDTEKRLATLIRRLLGIDKVGAEDSFFDLGGDSLKGMLLLKRIRSEFNVDLTLTDFFDGQTPRKMGRTIDQMGNLSKKQHRASKIII